MTAPLPLPVAARRLLGPAFEGLSQGLVLVGAPSAVGKTCLSLNLAAHCAAHQGELLLYCSAGSPKEVILARLAKNLTPDGETVDLGLLGELPLVVLDGANPRSSRVLEAAEAFVLQEGRPSMVLVNDLQSLRPPKDGLSGMESAIEILADLRAVSKLCEAPVVVFSQLSEGKRIANAIVSQADRVITVALTSEDPDHKHLQVSYFDPPDREVSTYELTLIRQTGVMGPRL
jgi:hypothetical protein